MNNEPKFDFDTRSNDNWVTYYVETVDLKSNLPYKQTKNVYIDLLKKEQSRYKPSAYTEFKPVACIVYYSVFGWTGQWVAKFYKDLEGYNADLTGNFADEPCGKYGKKRSNFLC